jgi:hypothetical protein
LHSKTTDSVDRQFNMTVDDEASKVTAAKALLGWGNSQKTTTPITQPPQSRPVSSKSELNHQNFDNATEDPKAHIFTVHQYPDPNSAAKEVRNASNLLPNKIATVTSRTTTPSTTLGTHSNPPPVSNESPHQQHRQHNMTETQVQSQFSLHHREQPQQEQEHHHHLINANSMLSMTSIGFGIDSSPSAALGDATDASLKAVQDAMERSNLRLPISSPAHSLLQIKVKLGVPPRQDGSSEPMTVNVARLSAFLPSVIPILPITVQVGGLYIPSESQGAPSICTAVACITLQSQAATLPMPISSSPTLTASHPSFVPQVSAHPHQQEHESLISLTVQQASMEQLPLASRRTSSQVSPNPQHFDHFVAATMSGPEAFNTLDAGANPVTIGKPPVQPQSDRHVHRSNSIEMLAMVTEQIRNNSAGNAQQIASAEVAAAARTGAGLATAALQGTQSMAINLGQLLNENGRLLVMPKADIPQEVSKDDGDDGNCNGGLANYNYKKLPPGVTTKNNQRLFVKHRYRDYSIEKPGRWENDANSLVSPKGTIKLTAPAFPVKLHETLSVIERDGFSDIVGWLPHGR